MREISCIRKYKDPVIGFSWDVGAPYDQVVQTQERAWLPVAFFAAGKGIETPADGALMMQLGCDAECLLGLRFFRIPRGRRSVLGT